MQYDKQNSSHHNESDELANRNGNGSRRAPTPADHGEDLFSVAQRFLGANGNANGPTGNGIEPVGFERQAPSGRHAPADTTADETVPPDRAPTGRFVSPDRTDPDIGRRPDGRFVDMDADAGDESGSSGGPFSAGRDYFVTSYDSLGVDSTERTKGVWFGDD